MVVVTQLINTDAGSGLYDGVGTFKKNLNLYLESRD